MGPYRPLFILFSLLLLLTVAPTVAIAQDGDVGDVELGGLGDLGWEDVDWGDIVDEGIDRLLMATDVCDYVEYLELVQTLSDSWDMVQDLHDYDPGDQRSRYFPVWDPVNNLLEATNTRLNAEMMRNESRKLIAQIESTCQHGIQTDETNRLFELARAAAMGIGEDLEEVMEILNPEDRDPYVIPGTDGEFMAQDFTTEFNFGHPINPTHPGDEALRQIRSAVDETLTASGQMVDVLNDYELDLDKLVEQMLLRPEEMETEDEAGNTVIVETCPDGYPNPEEDELPVDQDGEPYCGPVGPERAQVIASQATLLLGQLEGIRLAAEAHQGQISAAELFVQMEQMKITESIRRRVTGF